MKTVLIPTDLSAAADNASRYALHIARAINADIKLCIAVKADQKPGSLVALKGKTLEKMESLTGMLSAELVRSSADAHHPRIDYMGTAAPVFDAVSNLVKQHQVNIVVMGLSGADGQVPGVNSKAVMEKATFPAIFVPAKFHFKPIHRIAIATQLKKTDIDLLVALSHLARQLHAEILVAHITDQKYDSTQHQHLADAFMAEAVQKSGYEKIVYEHIKSNDVDRGLDWITEHGQIQMLVTVHHQHGFMGKLFGVNHTEKLAKHTQVPLLVFPESLQQDF